MKNALTFGIMLGPHPPWHKIVEQAKSVEILQFDKLWVPDHFVSPNDQETPWFECWTMLAGLAPLTSKISLGTMVSSMTLRNPAMLSRMALTIDHITGGRFELGIGAGGAPFCHAMTGISRWDPRECSERYREFVEIIDQMLKNEVTTYHGKYYDIQGAIMRPRPIAKPRPALSVAAHGPKGLRLAAQYGDAWNSYNPGKNLTPEQSSQVTRQRYERLCDYAREAGRDPAGIGRTFCFGWTSDGLFRSMDAFYDAIGRYREAGIIDFCFLYVPGNDAWKEQAITSYELLERIALETIPALRKDV